MTNFPRETVVSVTDGSPCFAGYSVAASHKDTKRHVILTASSKSDLANAFRDVTGEEVDMRAVHRTVIMRESDAQLDDAL